MILLHVLTCGLQEIPLEDCVRAQSKPRHGYGAGKRLTLWPRFNFGILLAYFITTLDLCWLLHKLFDKSKKKIKYIEMRMRYNTIIQYNIPLFRPSIYTVYM